MTLRDIPVVVVVTFPMAPDIDALKLRQILTEAGPEYVDVPGLRRKYFLSGDGVAGGVYEWDCRRNADAFFDNAWYASMTERYGERPQVEFFDAPAVADGVQHRLEIFLPED